MSADEKDEMSGRQKKLPRRRLQSEQRASYSRMLFLWVPLLDLPIPRNEQFALHLLRVRLIQSGRQSRSGSRDER